MKEIVKQNEMFSQLKRLGHPLNPEVERHALSLGDLTGLTKCGIHFTVLKPGALSTELHAHQLGDEFIFVLAGQATLMLGAEAFELNAGDFVGLPARGPSHALRNHTSENFIYLIGGDRPAFDVCDYPLLDKRVYFYTSGEKRIRNFVDVKDVDERT